MKNNRPTNSFMNFFAHAEQNMFPCAYLDERSVWNLISTSRQCYLLAPFYRELLERRFIGIVRSLVDSPSLTLTQRQLRSLNTPQYGVARLQMTQEERDASTFNLVVFVCSLNPDQKTIVFHRAPIGTLSFHNRLINVALQQGFTRDISWSSVQNFVLGTPGNLGTREGRAVSQAQKIERIKMALETENKRDKIDLLWNFFKGFEELNIDYKLLKKTFDASTYSFVLDVILGVLASKSILKRHKDKSLELMDAIKDNDVLFKARKNVFCDAIFAGFSVNDIVQEVQKLRNYSADQTDQIYSHMASGLVRGTRSTEAGNIAILIEDRVRRDKVILVHSEILANRGFFIESFQLLAKVSEDLGKARVFSEYLNWLLYGQCSQWPAINPHFRSRQQDARLLFGKLSEQERKPFFDQVLDVVRELPWSNEKEVLFFEKVLPHLSFPACMEKIRCIASEMELWAGTLQCQVRFYDIFSHFFNEKKYDVALQVLFLTRDFFWKKEHVYKLIDTFIELGKWDKALLLTNGIPHSNEEVFQEDIASHRKYIHILTGKFIEQRNLERAEATLCSIEQSNWMYESFLLLKKIAQGHLNRGNCLQSQRVNRLAKEFPSYQITVEIAQKYLEQGERSRAFTLVEGMKDNSQKEAFYFSLGQKYLKDGDKEGAWRHAAKSGSVNYHHLGDKIIQAYKKEGSYDKAWEVLSVLLKDSPRSNYIQHANDIVYQYVQANKYKEALNVSHSYNSREWATTSVVSAIASKIVRAHSLEDSLVEIANFDEQYHKTFTKELFRHAGVLRVSVYRIKRLWYRFSSAISGFFTKS